MMLFHLRLKNIGVKIFESIVLLKNARYSRGPSLKSEKNSSNISLIIIFEKLKVK
jgi:hypothetical protein